MTAARRRWSRLTVGTRRRVGRPRRRSTRRSPPSPAVRGPSPAAPTSSSARGRARRHCRSRSSRSTASTELRRHRRGERRPPPRRARRRTRRSSRIPSSARASRRWPTRRAIVGSHATRAQGTIGGNLMNASPAMETGGPLMCLDATVSLRSATGARARRSRRSLHRAGVDCRRAGRAARRDRHPAARRRDRQRLRPARVPPADGDRRRRRDRGRHARRRTP